MGEIGMMCSIDDAIEYLKDCQPRAKDDDISWRIINRLRYVRDKDVGKRPKFHAGRYGHKYDSWTCGNCGHTILEIGNNYCSECGYRIKWDSPRCLTK